jgi:hypothetical protein
MSVQALPGESRKQAACVLEVLAGMRTPEQAASALGVSVPTYYHLETRALRGLVYGCTPEPPGRKMALEKRLREAEARQRDLERELQRYRALVRSAQRVVGVPAPAPKAAGKRKPRKPRVRALRAVEALQEPVPPSDDGQAEGSAAPAAPDTPAPEATA